MPRDRYARFADLASVEVVGQDYRITDRERLAPVIIVAPHAGGIEPGTGEIARAVAGESYSFYCFEGVKLRRNEMLHITSTRFDEPSCRELVAKHRVVLALHGCAGEEPVIYLGGRNVELSRHMMDALMAAGFTTRGTINRDLAGQEPDNICNRGATGQGCQLEISYGLRKTLFESLSQRGRKMTQPPFDTLVGAIRQGIFAYKTSTR